MYILLFGSHGLSLVLSVYNFVIGGIDCPVIEASTYKGTLQNRGLPHLRTETDPVSETSWFFTLFYK
jgi:hypothetical protein